MPNSRVATVRSALVDSLDGTVRIDDRGEPVVDVDWLDGATLWLASDLVQHVPSGVRTTYGDLLDQRRTLDSVAVDWRSLTTVAVWTAEEDRALADTTADLVLRVPEDAQIWALLGRFALADLGSIDCADLTVGRPDYGARDGLAVQLGDLQDVLADIGLVPGGALFPEIALRARFDRYDSTRGGAGERVSATHAVERGEMRAGLDHVLSPEPGPDYVTGDGIDSGWLFCPGLRGGRHRFDWVGGVTWDHLGVATSAAPWLDAQADKHAAGRRQLARGVLLHVFQGYREQLVDAPDDLVERCVEAPEVVRAWIG